jgi:uncharacterized membrane protein YqjE
MIMLAQLESVNPAFGWNAVLFAVAVIGVVAAVGQWFNGRKRDVTLMEEFATRRELQDLAMRVEDKFESLRVELQEDKTEILRAGEARVVKLHDRINEVLSAVSELRGEVHANRANFARNDK